MWILLKQETVSGSGISWVICKVCTSLQIDNHASTPPLSFLQAGCPSCRPTNSIKALKPILPANTVNTYKVNDALTCASMKIVNWTENTHTETVDAQ